MDIKKLFAELTDPRDKIQQTYPFECLMLMSICAAFSGTDSFVGIEDYAETHKDFFDSYFGLCYTPRHDTFNRLFQILDMDEFEKWFRKQAQNIIDFIEMNHPNEGSLKHIAIDGKTVRNSGFTKPYHIVSGWLSRHKLTLGQVKVDEKSNEITAIPKLIESLDLKNTVVTIDAMGCQRQICEKIIAKQGQYIIGVKDNQPRLFESVKAQMEEDFENAFSISQTQNKGHGRHEKRWCTVQRIDNTAYDYRDWPGIKTIIAVDCDVLKKNRFGKEKRSFDTRYFVSNAELEAPEALEIIRAHWGIEINLHWRLDVSFDEDNACVQLENAAINLSALRKYAINILTTFKEKKSIKSMFRHCIRPDNVIKILNKIYDA